MLLDISRQLPGRVEHIGQGSLIDRPILGQRV